MGEPLDYEPSEGPDDEVERMQKGAAQERAAAQARRYVPTVFEFVLCTTGDRPAVTAIEQALMREKILYVRSRVGDDVELVVPIRHRARAEEIALGLLARRKRVAEITPKSERPDDIPLGINNADD